MGLFQWSLGLRRGSAVPRLPELRVRIPLEAWKSVTCEYSMLSGTGLRVGPITRPEQSYQVWCISVW